MTRNNKEIQRSKPSKLERNALASTSQIVGAGAAASLLYNSAHADMVEGIGGSSYGACFAVLVALGIAGIVIYGAAGIDRLRDRDY